MLLSHARRHQHTAQTLLRAYSHTALPCCSANWSPAESADCYCRAGRRTARRDEGLRAGATVFCGSFQGHGKQVARKQGQGQGQEHCLLFLRLRWGCCGWSSRSPHRTGGHRGILIPGTGWRCEWPARAPRKRNRP